MLFKSILIGSTSALFIATAASAADAIVAADPEPVDYVRVCDAYGTGYFYIPGTETCLKIEGYVRYQVNVETEAKDASDWNAKSRGLLTFTAKSDTEYGPLTGSFTYKATADSASSTLFQLDSAYLSIAGLQAGLFYSWWDDDIAGDLDSVATDTLFNSVSYTYESGSFKAGLSIDELEKGATTKPNDVGIAALLSGAAGKFSYQFVGGYDTDLEEGALRALGRLAVGPGSLELAAVWASGRNTYYRDSEWAIAASYEWKATDKLTITPGIEYQANWTPEWSASTTRFSNVNSWKAGLNVKYQIADNFYTSAYVDWRDRTSLEKTEDKFTGYFRLQRAF